jgi:hypothetical protein
LKNPPTSYQQPGVDLLLGLQHLQEGIDSGIFPNQYEFEAALQTLLYATHDAHVNLFAGILAAFTFASPYDIVSLSIDGIQLPKVYFACIYTSTPLIIGIRAKMEQLIYSRASTSRLISPRQSRPSTVLM